MGRKLAHEMELEQIGALLFAALCGALIPLIIMRQQKPSAASTAPSGGCPFGFGNSDAPAAASAPAEAATTRPRARSNSGCPFGYGNGAAAEALGFETGTAPEAAAAPQRVMVLTGASRGIGHGTVKLFISAGWRVITLSRSPWEANGKCPWKAGATDHIVVDLSDEESTHRAVQQIKDRIGPNGELHALVNNAGTSPKDAKGQRLNSIQTDTKLWKDVFQVNFFASIILARGLIEELKRGRGTVVNVTSIAGVRVHNFAGTAYATSKAALTALTREMAADLGPMGVRVNCISPGEIATDILSPGTEEMVAEIVPMRRLGTVLEVAHAIYFLVSEQSSYVNGAELHINGGQHVV